MIVRGKVGPIKSAIGLIVGLASMSSEASKIPLLLQPRKKGGLKISYSDASCYVMTVLTDCEVEGNDEVAVPASCFGFAGKADDEVLLDFRSNKVLIQTARQRSEVAVDMSADTLKQAAPESLLDTKACRIPAEFIAGVHAVSFSSTESMQPPVKIEMPAVTKKGDLRTVQFSSGDSCATAMWALQLKDEADAEMNETVLIDRNVFLGVVGRINKKSVFQLGVSDTMYAIRSADPPFLFQIQKQAAVTEDSARTQASAIFGQLKADDQCVGFRSTPATISEAIRDTIGIGRAVSGAIGDTSVRFTLSGKRLVLTHENEAVSTEYAVDVETAYPGDGYFVAPPHLVDEIMKLCSSRAVVIRWWDAAVKDQMKAGTAVIEGSEGTLYAISLENVAATPKPRTTKQAPDTKAKKRKPGGA